MKAATPKPADRLPKRLQNELKTISVMISLYCKNHHSRAAPLCHDCSELLDYARLRLSHCPFKDEKPTCGKCTIHCYKPSRRNMICKVMRYSGPRMLLRHPILALLHLMDGRRRLPQNPRIITKSPTSDRDIKE